VNIPDGVTVIGYQAFHWDKQIKSIVIPASVLTIKEFAFYFVGANAMESMSFLGLKCPKIEGYYSFTGLKEGLSVKVPTCYKEKNFAGLPIDNSLPCYECGENVIYRYEESTGELFITGKGTMYNFNENRKTPWLSYISSIKSVSVGTGVTSIGTNSFTDGDNMVNATIGCNVSNIGNNAFKGCSKLENVKYLGMEAPTYGTDVFYKCKKLECIDVPTNYSGNNFCGKKLCGSEHSFDSGYLTIPSTVLLIISLFFIHFN